MSRLARWLDLPTRDKAALLLFAAALPLVDFNLRLFGYRRTLRGLDALSRHRPRRSPDAAQIADANRLAKLARIGGRHGLTPASCLRQALALHAWLRWKGLESEVHFGIAPPQENGLDAHAWVESGGIALGEPDQPRYTTFERG